MLSLPIHAVIPALIAALAARDECVLEAPPGAGKTTGVPLALLNQPWLGAQKILMLEPRRLAARAAACRMAELLGENVGERVGYRVRLEARIGPSTRIEVVTEGILTRMLQENPALDGYGLVIFDEFHERSLDADLGLSLALLAREVYGDVRATPLKLLVMSATLDGAAISDLLAQAPVVKSEGRSFPVVYRYAEPWRADQDLVARVSACIHQVLAEQRGSVLVFLPGQGEIRRVLEQLQERLPADVLLAPLYGDLSLAQQRLAIEPAATGLRKVVLATNIAETSLTIDGIRVVIDSGVCREPEFDPNNGVTRLATKRISKASSIQRAGRAGRLAPGVCYRLWSETQQQELAAYSSAEISKADLAPLALQLLQWGVSDPDEMRWLTPPPIGAWQQACQLLMDLRALERASDGALRITDHGRAMSRVGAHPRLAHMLARSVEWGLTPLAADLAALLSERDVLAVGADIQYRLEWLHGERKGSVGSLKRVQQLARQFRSSVAQLGLAGQGAHTVEPMDQAGLLLALAYPDRIAKRRTLTGLQYQLSNGRSAQLQDGDHLRNQAWLVVAETGGHQNSSSDKIFMAASLNVALFNSLLAEQIQTHTVMGWDDSAEKFLAEQRRQLGRLVLDIAPIAHPTTENRKAALLSLVAERGLSLLQWSDSARQLRQRVILLRQFEPEDWPDLSDAGLLNSLAQWLGPYLDQVKKLSDFKTIATDELMRNSLSWEQQQRLIEAAPTHLQVPSGSQIAIDYSMQPPVLAVKLQEMFGCLDTPTIAKGRVKLLIHLLSPARRPLQITQDLAGFWSGSYQAVKKDMKGRYPRHPWPDNPLQAIATAKVKNKM